MSQIKGLVEQLLRLGRGEEITSFVKERGEEFNEEVIELICRKVEEDLSSDPARALKIAETSLTASQALGNPFFIAICKRAKANALCALGAHQESLNLVDEAVEFFRAQGNELQMAIANVGKVEALRIIGRYRDALQLSQKTTSLLRSHRAEYELAKLERITASIHFWRNEFAKSLQLLERAESYFAANEKRLELAQTKMNKSIVLPHLNRFREALAESEEARRFFQEMKLKRQLANVDYSTGNIYYYMGQYGKALEAYREAKDAYRILGLKRAQANVDTCIANTYLRLGLYEETIESYSFAQTVFQEEGMRYSLALTWYDQAVAYGGLGEFSKADELFQRAEEVFEEEGLRTKIAGIKLERSKILLAQGDYAKALRLSSEAIDLFTEVSGPGLLTATAKLVAAAAHLKSGELDEAEGLYHSLQREYKIPWILHQAYYGLGKISYKRGAKDKAYSWLRSSIEEIEKMQVSLRGREKLTISFLQDKLEAFHDMVSLCLELGKDEEALYYVEKAKSRALVDLLSQKLDFKGKDEKFQKTVEKLREELNWWYSKAEEEGKGGERGGGVKVFQAIRSRERRLQRLIEDREAAIPLGRGLLRSTGVSLPEIRDLLGEGEMLLEYYVANDEVHLFSLTKHDLAIYQGLSSSREVGDLLERFRFQLTKLMWGPKPGRERLAWIGLATKDYLRSLHRILIEPIANLREYPRLIIIPHSLLHLLPFGALHDGEEFLIEKHRICYYPSSHIFKLCSQRESRKGGPLLAIGVPDERIPAVTEEIETLKALFPEALTFTGRLATRKVLERYAEECNILHIASHGVFREDSPLFSRLKLADGWLTVGEVYDLKLNASLVTLSGCDTGLNTLALGDEVLGMSRGFLYAGASSLLVSLWAVNDKSTKALMETFYRGLRQGKSKSQALRDAQVGMLKGSEKWSHPYYWAPFILIGKD